MTRQLLMGNTAAAFGALQAGVNLVCGYPGTPSTEVLEAVAAQVDSWYQAGLVSAGDAPHVEWSINEKAALEVAAGASMCGARALVTMKQVGLNVASDPLMTLTYLGAKGGLVLYVADDPGPISSQTEQDTRQFAQFAKVPVFDAATPEELYTLMPRAFELSEQFSTPVIVRSTTRICHGSAAVELADSDPVYTPHQISGFEKNPHWVTFPALANQAHREIMERLPIIANLFSNLDINQIIPESEPGTVGVVASGVSWAYLLDSLGSLTAEQRASLRLLRVATPMPFIDQRAVEFLTGLDKVLVFEELEAVVERELQRVAGTQHLPVDIYGKQTGHTAIAGENSVTLIAEQLGEFLERNMGRFSVALQESATGAGSLLRSVPPASPPRPPVLCAGCPHRASFSAVKRALRGKPATYSGDIGCYTLGNAMPLDMVDTCVCMGAGFTVPQGMHWAQGAVRHLGFVGDSTFFASGITGVANAVYNRAPVTLFVLDNSITAMTGSQPHPGTGMRMSYDAVPADIANAISIPAVLRALGVGLVLEQDPLEFDQAVDVVRQAVDFDGVSAVVFKAPCINVSKPQTQPDVDTNKCIACRICINTLGCPALTMAGNGEQTGNQRDNYIEIDRSLCYGCDLCVQVCPYQALISNHKGGQHAV